MTTADGKWPFSIINPVLDQAVIYLGQSATLTVTFRNGTATDVPVASGAKMTFYLPAYFAAQDVANATLDLTAMPAGWTAEPVDNTGGIPIVYGGTGTAWHSNETLTFTVTATSSASQAASGFAQINSANLPGVQSQVTAQLAIIAAPKPGNAKLSEVLAVSLDHQGIVYSSDPDDPLSNSLFLNFKNTGAGRLYTGSMPRATNPHIEVTFTYGESTGALVPVTDKAHPVQSAWNIKSGIHDTGGNDWQAHDPDPSTTTPSWCLEPSATNAAVIGVDDTANITFSFDSIVTFAPPGHTQMMLRFEDFMKDDTVAYDQEVFTLDILKQVASDSRGLLSIFSAIPVGHVSAPTDQFVVTLRWTMRQVNKVAIINSYSLISPMVDRVYPTPPLPLDYDEISIPLTGFQRTTPVFFTVQAFDGSDAYLNSMQFTAVVQADEFVDPSDGQSYPVVRIGNQQWMARNLRRSANSFPSTGDPTWYGRLYAEADADIPGGHVDGWRLPQRSDWDSLVLALDGPGPAYKALVSDGKPGFVAILGGYRDSSGNYSDMNKSAYYWTGTPGAQGGNTQYANLSSTSRVVNLGFEFASGYALSVRYVRDIT